MLFEKRFAAELGAICPERRFFVVAVSGGVDSVVLLRLLAGLGWPLVVAHVNFQLRGEESERDMRFVEGLAAELGLECVVERCDTLAYAEARRLGIQVAARALRYAFFERLRMERKADFIATAHHLNDSIETIFLNMAKGCGLRGLHGILPLQNTLIRPLVWATKSEILAHAAAQKWDFVEDSSNASDKYSRNLVRHRVVPALAELNPSIEATFAENIQRFGAAEKLLDWALSEAEKQFFKEKTAEKLVIDLAGLRAHPMSALFAYEWLSKYGFSASQSANMLADGLESGAFWLADVWEARYYRGELTITPRAAAQAAQETQFFANLADLERAFELEILVEMPKLERGSDLRRAYFDLDALRWPLALRGLRAGDSFRPLGMRGKRKKVSDFLKDRGVGAAERGNLAVLVDAVGEILWLVGYGRSEAAMCGAATGRVLRLQA